MKKNFKSRLRLLVLLSLFTCNVLYVSGIIIPLVFSNAKYRKEISEITALLETRNNLKSHLVQTENMLEETLTATEAAMQQLSANIPLNKTQKRLYELTESSGLRLQKLKYETPLPLLKPNDSRLSNPLLGVGTQLSLTGKWQDYLVFRERIAKEFDKIEITEERIESHPDKAMPEMHLNFTMFRQKNVLQ